MLTIRTVHCPTDFSETADRGLDLAVQVCERFGAKLVLHHNMEALPPLYLASIEVLPVTQLQLEEEQQARAEQLLRDSVANLPHSFPAEIRVTKGHAANSILSVAAESAADLIVMGTHGRSGLGHMLLGSTTEQVIAGARCPVLTARLGGYNEVFPDSSQVDESWEVLHPIDFTPRAVAILDYARGMAERLPIELRLLHVVKPISWDDMRGYTHFNVPEFQQARVREARQKLEYLVEKSLHGRAKLEVRMGDVAAEIVRCAEANRARLILMGLNPDREINDLLFGPTCYGVLRKSRCPIWVIPAGYDERRNMASRLEEIAS
jgi:universal stress protein A